MLNEYQEKQYFALLQGCLKTGYWWPMWEWLDEECKLDASSDYWQYARAVGRYPGIKRACNKVSKEIFLASKLDRVSIYEDISAESINPDVPRPILRNEYEYHLQHGHEQKGEDWSRLIEWADLYGTPEQVLMARVLGRYRLASDVSYLWHLCGVTNDCHNTESNLILSYEYCRRCEGCKLLANQPNVGRKHTYDATLINWLTAEHNHDHLADLELIHKRRLNPEIHLPQSEVVT